MAYFIYLFLKLAFYSIWGAVGLKLYRNASGSELMYGINFGALRTLIGLATGMTLVFAADFLGASSLISLRIMVAILIPVRWIEWSILAMILGKYGFRSNFPVFFLGSNLKDRLWRLAGIGLSFSVDILAERGYLGSFFVC